MSIGSLKKDLPIPLYHQLKTLLLEAIKSGEWMPDQQLPNEGRLAETFGVSKITVRQALQELAGLGYVRREQGRGTFVSRPKLSEGPRELTSFTEEMARHSLVVTSRVLEQTLTETSADVADALQLSAGSRVFILKRVRIAGGEPLAIQTAHIPVDLTPGLLHEDFANVSLYEVLQARYGLTPSRARETFFAVPADASIAALLGIPAGAPAFAGERVTSLEGGKPFEFVKSVMRADRYRIVLNLVK